MEFQETLGGMGVDKGLSGLFNSNNPLGSCWFGLEQLMELLFLDTGK